MPIKKQTLQISLISAVILTLAACGGGGGDSEVKAPLTSTPVESSTPVTTVVMDGIIQNAVVCLDSNSNGVCELLEPQGHTDISGTATIRVPDRELATAKLVAVIHTGATDADNGVIRTSYNLTAPAGKTAVISPLTHMVQTKIDVDKVSLAVAEQFVKTNAGLSVSPLDDFISKRATSAGHRMAGEVARFLVVSTQQALESYTLASIPGNTDPDLRAAEGERISRELVLRLPEFSKAVVDLNKLPCASTQNQAVTSCGSVIAATSPLVTRNPAAPPAVAPPVNVAPVVVLPPTLTPPPLITLLPQTLTFEPIADQVLPFYAPPIYMPCNAEAVCPPYITPTVSIPLIATASSKLPVTVTSRTPDFCKTDKVSIIFNHAEGFCTLVATQAGNHDYEKAAAISRTFKVSMLSEYPNGYPQTIGITPISSQTIGFSPAGAPLVRNIEIAAIASSGLAVSVSVETPLVCVNVPGSSATLTLLRTGLCRITATQAGNGTFAAASPAFAAFAVKSEDGSKSQQAITVKAPATISIPDAGSFPPGATLRSLDAESSSTSGLQVSARSQTPDVCDAMMDTLLYTMGSTPMPQYPRVTTKVAIRIFKTGFPCQIVSSQAGNDFYLAAKNVISSIEVTR